MLQELKQQFMPHQKVLTSLKSGTLIKKKLRLCSQKSSEWKWWVSGTTILITNWYVDGKTLGVSSLVVIFLDLALSLLASLIWWAPTMSTWKIVKKLLERQKAQKMNLMKEKFQMKSAGDSRLKHTVKTVAPRHKSLILLLAWSQRILCNS